MKDLDKLLANGPYICGDSLTLADLLAYGDIGQLQPKFFDLLNFDPYPNVSRWLQTMRALPYHDMAHEGLVKFLPKWRQLRVLKEGASSKL